MNNLVISGLVKREIDTEDRRYVTISLTDSGHKLFEGIEEKMNAANNGGDKKWNTILKKCEFREIGIREKVARTGDGIL